MNDIRKQLEKYPEFLDSQDLVKLGIYPTLMAVHQARKKGYSPQFIRIGKKKIIYSKEAIIQYLEKNTKTDLSPWN